MMELQNSVTTPIAMGVDPFLVEALQNPRHRLTILRMELDIQKFIQNTEQELFEFQHFPTSYLRLAAHRVAQHYGLQTMVFDNFSDGQKTRILVKRLTETKHPAVCLSDVPTKTLENEKHEHIKVVLKTVEERKEDYDRARARIFSPQTEGPPLTTNPDGKSLCNFKSDENDGFKNDGNASCVAILRDREKDLTDPDYDRSYERYVRNLPMSQGFNSLPLTLPKFQPPCVQYDPVIQHPSQLPIGQSQSNVCYRSSGMNPYPVVGAMNHMSRDPVYMQWPSHSMMYAHAHEQFRHAVFQAPFCQQQPLSFDYSQNR
ncbi:putative R3H domain, SUZ domain, R3H domain superfamily protein [Helianthus annuus]|nr:putative R3H domain, SUZ domain, R3H domain superfamily protein [Helianthus annuus]